MHTQSQTGWFSHICLWRRTEEILVSYENDNGNWTAQQEVAETLQPYHSGQYQTRVYGCTVVRAHLPIKQPDNASS